MKFRKKPVEIEAIQLRWDTWSEVCEFITLPWGADGVHGVQIKGGVIDDKGEEIGLVIPTLEGNMTAIQNDWIIKGVNGEFYPCKPNIFEKTYIQGSMGEVSDGYHTFNELYHHRAILFSVICNANLAIAWKTKKHHDGTMFTDMFIVGINTPEGQATYHYYLDPYWQFFHVPELDQAPEWDGHTPVQAIERLLRFGQSHITPTESHL